MSACRDVRVWITENVRVPAERFIERAEESCTEARRWVEREVRRRIVRRRTRTERRCKRRKCKWWCACCNKWVCWVETIVERVVEWIVEVVGEWVVETICKVVVKVIKVVVEVVISVVRLVVVGLTCLFTDPAGALDALADFWYDLVDIVNDIGHLVSDLLGAISNLLDITREFVLDLGDMLGPIGRFFLGIVAGFLDIVRRIVDGVKGIFDGIVDIVTGILHLDFCYALEGLTNGVGMGLLQAIFGVTGVLSLGGNGPRDAFDRDALRRWLQSELEDRFEDDRLEELEDNLRMGSTSFGIRWPVVPLRCTISSRSEEISLRDLHEEGLINLYEMGGYAPFGCKETPVTRSVYQLIYTGTDYRVSLGDLRAYLEDGPKAAPEFVLVAGDKRVFKEMLAVAERKMRQMAIWLEFRPLDTFEIQANECIILSEDPFSEEITSFAERITAELSLSDICDLPAVIVFGYEPQRFGLASFFRRGGQRRPTAATVRSSFMNHLFGTVLAHEMGHCFSLRHEGHDGMEHIMFTMADILDPGPEDDLERVTDDTFAEYILLGGEPHFTFRDGQNAWRWILEETTECLPK